MPEKIWERFNGSFAPHTGNLIKNLIFHECSVPFTVYATTFVPCFLKMVITVLTWDIGDLIRNSSESVAEKPLKRGQRKRHMRSRRVSSRYAPTQGTRSQNGLNHVLKWTAPLERAGYAMLLYGATEQFSADWTSLLYNFEFCGKPPSEGPLQRHANPNHTVSTGTTQNLTLHVIDQNRANWPTSVWNATIPFGWYQVTMTARFVQNTATAWYAEIGFEIPFSSVVGIKWSGKNHAIQGQGVEITLSEQVFLGAIGGSTIAWYYRSSPIPTGIDIEEASISVYSFQPGR